MPAAKHVHTRRRLVRCEPSSRHSPFSSGAGGGSRRRSLQVGRLRAPQRRAGRRFRLHPNPSAKPQPARRVRVQPARRIARAAVGIGVSAVAPGGRPPPGRAGAGAQLGAGLALAAWRVVQRARVGPPASCLPQGRAILPGPCPGPMKPARNPPSSPPPPRPVRANPQSRCDPRPVARRGPRQTRPSRPFWTPAARI